ncbi:HNH endonuclease [Streptomyces sp. NRRL S-1813]|uniref:HNH endonuclease n=1 Tax=Streptomyces sp. NRRL S-1813 TaxID=1463888 RepID=UPI001F35C636|nr:HNH endonuclease [Streptomyces sp. NRRL S-1813]
MTLHCSTTGVNAVKRAHRHRWTRPALLWQPVRRESVRLHKHHFTCRRHGGSDESKNLRLVHSECHRQHHSGDGDRRRAEPVKPSGLLEP